MTRAKGRLLTTEPPRRPSCFVSNHRLGYQVSKLESLFADFMYVRFVISAEFSEKGAYLEGKEQSFIY